MHKDERKGVSLLAELKLEDDMISRKNAVQKHLTRHIPKYLVDIVLRFLGTRDYTLITKPKYTAKNLYLKYPKGISFNDQKHVAVGYTHGEVAIFDIGSQEIIKWRKFKGTCSSVVSFGNLWLVYLKLRAIILILDSNLMNMGVLNPKLCGRSEGMEFCKKRGWLAISNYDFGNVKFFEMEQIKKIVLKPIEVMDIVGLKNPAGLCFNLDGTILAVAERGADRISLFNLLKKEKLLSFGNDKLGSPNDVKLDTDGNFLVYDTGNRRLCIFDPSGKFLLSLLDGFFKDSGNTFSYISVDSSGTIAVSDNDNHQIFVF